MSNGTKSYIYLWNCYENNTPGFYDDTFNYWYKYLERFVEVHDKLYNNLQEGIIDIFNNSFINDSYSIIFREIYEIITAIKMKNENKTKANISIIKLGK